mmetsp:Transcript_8965/g.16150  ORF Transcript_8965/g.16150 Transcript_8965/m.16150 type:complete len:327 (-) Transcript_8965:70-1050(-)
MGNIVKPMWAECPAVTRTLLIAYPSISIGMSMAAGLTSSSAVSRLFLCSISNTIGQFSLWTLCTSMMFRPFGGGMSFLMMLLEAYMALMHLPQREHELGSALFSVWLLLANCCINLLFLLLSFVRLVLQDHWAYGDINCGLWPVLMLLMTQRMLGDPDGQSSFWGLFFVKNKWYPLVIVGIFSLLNTTVMWNLLAAIAIGYISFFRPQYNFEVCLPSGARLAMLDRLCSGRSYFGGQWLSVDVASAGRCTTSSTSAAEPRMWGSSFFSQASKQPAEFKLFSGQGNRLGDSVPLQPSKEMPISRGGTPGDATVDVEAPLSENKGDNS